MRYSLKPSKIVFAFISVFLSGIALGIGGTLFVSSLKKKKNDDHKKTHRGAVYAKMRIMTHMRRELDLTDLQEKEISKIISDMSKKLQDIKRRQLPLFAEIISGSFSRIETILNDEQKKKFENLRKRINHSRMLKRGWKNAQFQHSAGKFHIDRRRDKEMPFIKSDNVFNDKLDNDMRPRRGTHGRKHGNGGGDVHQGRSEN